MSMKHLSRSAKSKLDRERQDRIEQAHRDTLAVVASGKCPECGAGLRQNLSLAGWWQCEQLGSVGFRKDASKPGCSWQGFTR